MAALVAASSGGSEDGAEGPDDALIPLHWAKVRLGKELLG